MSGTIVFGRIESKRDTPGIAKELLTDAQCRQPFGNSRLNQRGSNWEVTIENLLTEDIFKFVSLRDNPEKIESEYYHARERLDGLSGMVIIRLEYSKNNSDHVTHEITNAARYSRVYKIPGSALVNNSFHISELGWDLCLRSNIEKTASLLMQDTKDRNANSIAVPRDQKDEEHHASLVFGDYSKLMRHCVERTSRIQMRVGINVRRDESVIPDFLKNFRIAVLDRDFSPYHNNRMTYDPTLSEDEFILENLYEYDSSIFRMNFSTFFDQHGGEIYVVDNLKPTRRGELTELALFANDAKLAQYYHDHASQVLYDELASRITTREGSQILRQKIARLENEVSNRDERITESEEEIKGLNNQIKAGKRSISELEKTIDAIKSNKEERYGYDAIMEELRQGRLTLELDRDRLFNDRYELDQKMRLAEANNRASWFKSFADVVKSSWGIIVSTATIGAAAYKGYKNIKAN